MAIFTTSADLISSRMAAKLAAEHAPAGFLLTRWPCHHPDGMSSLAAVDLTMRWHREHVA
jgi:hypothetical protein